MYGIGMVYKLESQIPMTPAPYLIAGIIFVLMNYFLLWDDNKNRYNRLKDKENKEYEK
ncbi:hypothetical protein [Clostridium sp. JS66]|uniref:hypothetical protein n=1 Tax=Clostridium sp. JS66 TaxID=3064705 RepID=UPI00298D751E|nr:hypothetical protein [Clostridium sp. JS66]WPC43900.1 hypothetical protein Q6H37_10610 [Clostridium sp. JS66]